MEINKFINKLNSDWEENKVNLIQASIASIKNTFSQVSFDVNQINTIPNLFGVYAFFIRAKSGDNKIENFHNFRDESIKFSPLIKKDKSKGIEDFADQIIYVGKAEKISNRINEHCYQEKEKTTYGLKLKNRTELINKYDIFYGYFNLNNESQKEKEASQFVITNLESELRKRLKPWVGKQ